LTNTDNGTQFGKLMEGKGYKFTRIHKMYQRKGDEDIYDILKEYGCLPVPDGMQCPYCDWNRYNGSREVIERKLNKHMQITHLISNNNHALNMLLNINGTDWWMDFEYKEGIIDVDFHRNDLGFCTGGMCGAIEKNLENYKSHKFFAYSVEM
jgi:hypothetical protein